jgi:hypothetical protein
MSKGHEPHRVDAPALHKLGGLFALLLTLILCVMYVLWRHVHSWTLTMPAQVVPPAPRLQADPPADRATQYRLQAQRLESYGWNDADHRVAHIPIERAMALLAQHEPGSGQPDRSASR